nr:response regulator [bacterium]
MDAKRILSVDDSEFALAKLKGALSNAGFEVLKPANSVDEALESIERDKPDLVTLDIVMAGTDGVEGVKRILSKFPGTRILMVS